MFNDEDIILFDHPIDYEILNQGNYYVDPSLQDSTKAFYTAVPVDYKFADFISYEIIKKLFLIQPILNEIENGTLGKTRLSSSMLLSKLSQNRLSLVQLEAMSLFLTGNLDKLLKDKNRSKNITIENIASPAPVKSGLNKVSSFWDWFLPSSFRPTGTIKFKDDQLGERPFVGIRVAAGYWYYWRSSRTNRNEYFRNPETWRWSVRYEIHYDQEDFVLEDSDSWYGADLKTVGPMRKGAWNKTFTGKQAMWAVIFTAAYDYYYKNIDGLHRPHLDAGWFSVPLNIKVYDSKREGSVAGEHYQVLFLSTNLSIWTQYPSATWVKHQELYSTTIHELAHNAHFEHMETMLTSEFMFYFLDEELKETWASGVQWYLTKKRYKNYTRDYGGDYKGIVQDLIDTENTYAKRAGFVGTEHVSGFTISQIEKAVFKSSSLNELRNNLRQMYPSASSPGLYYSTQDLNKLFEYWRTQ